MRIPSRSIVLLAVLAGAFGGCTLRPADMSSMQGMRSARSLYVPIGDRNRACLYGCTDNHHYVYAIPPASSSFFHVGDMQFYP
jgi:hypothetical protein